MGISRISFMKLYNLFSGLQSIRLLWSGFAILMELTLNPIELDTKLNDESNGAILELVFH
jgi:hypothetical protein